MGKPAAKKLDKILSVTPGDVHIIIPPTGTPVPVPHPCTSIIKDEVATSVKVTGQPGAVKGSISKHTPPHIPQGGTFSNPPSNKGKIFITSSLKVYLEDREAAVLGDTAKMCADPVDQPVGKVVGTAATVLIAATSSGSGGEGDGTGDAQKAGGAKGASAGTPPMNKVTGEGHPVDVVTGNVIAHGEDFTLDAPIPLQFVRTYCSANAGTDGPLGHGWSHNLQQRIELVEKAHPDWAALQQQLGGADDDSYLVFHDANGVPTTYRLPRDGSEISDPFRRRTIRREGTGHTLVDEHGIAYRFSPLTRSSTTLLPAEVVDRNGNQLHLRYDDGGRVREIEDAYGRILILVYETTRIAELRVRFPGDREERRWCSYTYSRGGDLLEVTDRARSTVQYAYDDHLLVEDRDPDGYAFFFSYDASRRCVRTWGQTGYLSRRFDYDPSQRRTRVTNGEGETTIYCYDERGVVCRIERGDFFQHTRFDDQGRVLARGSGGGIVVSFEHDAAGRVQAATDADGNAHRFAYNEFGQVTRLTDPLGHTQEFEYDDRGNLVAHTLATGATTRHEHDDRGRVVRQVFPDGSDRSLTYDRFGNVSRAVQGDDVETFRHDAPGNLLHRTLADGTTYEYEWNDQGFPVRETRDGRTTAVLEYTAGGYVASMTDASGTLKRFVYGPPGVPVTIAEHAASSGGSEGGLRSRIEIDLDSEGRPRRATNELDLSYTFSYDGAGRLGRQTNPDGAVLSFTYDPSGFVAALRSSRGDLQRFEYNGRGLPTRVFYADGTEDAFEYDPLGRTMAATNGAVRLEWEYDAAGQPVVRRQGDFELRAEPDALGRRVSWISADDFRFDIVPDSRGRIEAIEFGGRRIALSTERTPQLVERRRMPNGVSELREHDRHGRLASTEVRRGEQVLSRRQLEYRPEGLLGSILDSVRGDRRFTYDAIDRLIEVTGTDPERYAFDRNGNLASSHRFGSTTFDAPDVLRRIDGRTYDYDPDGRVTGIRERDRAWSLRYNAKGELARVDLPDGGVVHYVYDPLGRRIEKRFEGGTRDGKRTTFVWNGGQLFKEEHFAGDSRIAERFYLFLSDGPCARVDREGSREEAIFYHNDHLGTPQFCTGEQGEVVWSFGGDSYGYEALRPDDYQNIRLPGQYFDEETGLHYNRYRYYDPVSARYLQPDPLDCLADPNRYHYPFDPLGTIDPMGLQGLMVLNADPGDKTLHSYENHWMAGHSRVPLRTGYRSMGNAGTTGDLLDPNLNLSNVSHVVISAHGNPTSIAVGRPGLWARIRRRMPWSAEYTAGSMSGKQLAALLKSRGFTGKVTLVVCNAGKERADGQPNVAQELADGLGQGSEVVAWDEDVIVDYRSGRPSAIWNMGGIIPGMDPAMQTQTRDVSWGTMPESYGRWTFKPNQAPVPG